MFFHILPGPLGRLVGKLSMAQPINDTHQQLTAKPLDNKTIPIVTHSGMGPRLHPHRHRDKAGGTHVLQEDIFYSKPGSLFHL